jgi:hypothetical protein
VLRYAAAEYHRMTRDFKRAGAELEQVLATVLLISHCDHGVLIVTGVALLAFEHDARFALPAATAASISQFYARKGATSMLHFAD